jgi:predicted enzyme related to lactoylglutathione lyase
MINAIHAIINATDADKARAFFKDVLHLPSVDAGRGWLIFALPPAEIAAHPTDDPALSGTCNLYLMCDDINATVADLATKGVPITTPIADRGWGLITSIDIPGAGPIGLYQPKHPVAYAMK